MNTILLAIWFFLPAGAANAAPVFVSKIPALKNWNAPMDFGRSFRGKRIFGEHKTWRGLVSAVLIGGATGSMIFLIYPQSASELSLVSQPAVQMTAFGALLGGGALLGDAVKSFFKRRVSVGPGESWFPFDQTDYIIGGLAASLFIVRLSIIEYAAILFVWFALHIIAVYAGYRLGLRDKPL